MPTGVVEDEDDDPISARSGFFGESRQQSLEERLRDAVGNVPEALAGRRRNESRDIEPFEAVMAWSDGAHADWRPNPTHDRLQAKPVFVCRKGFDRNARMGLRFLRDDLGDFFLNASCSASVAAFGLRGRGFWTDHPRAFNAYSLISPQTVGIAQNRLANLRADLPARGEPGASRRLRKRRTVSARQDDASPWRARAGSRRRPAARAPCARGRGSRRARRSRRSPAALARSG